MIRKCFESLRFTAMVTLIWLAAGASHAEGTSIEDCVIEPNKSADVSSAADGVIDKLEVKRGDLVKQGQVLATLKSGIEKATVELARVRSERDQAIKAKRARHEFTQRRLKRNQELFAQNLISAQVVDEAETDVLLAELELGEFLEERVIAVMELERAEEALELRTIRSPFRGVVVDVLVAPGESIENRPLFKIASIDPLNVEIIAPVQLFDKIKKGSEALVYPEEPIGGEHKARVVIVDRILDAASGTFGIRLQLRNRKYRLPAGLRCRARFDIQTQDVSAGGASNKNDDTLEADVKGQSGKLRPASSSGTPGLSYTVYLFSTRSRDVANQVNEQFTNEGHDTEILVSADDSLTRYRVAVVGFESYESAKEYSAMMVGTMGISKPWIGKEAGNN